MILFLKALGCGLLFGFTVSISLYLLGFPVGDVSASFWFGTLGYVLGRLQ